MASTLLYIRHMVCVKCILVVREQLVELGLVPLRVELGEVELRDDATTIDWPRLRQCLEAEGFEILDQLSPQQRVEAARRLLREGTLPVGRVARELGYSNLGHLSRQFQRETGASPSEYRRQCLSSAQLTEQ